MALVAGCETTQPLQIDEQTFEVTVDAVGATINSANVWDMYYDADNNGVQDAGEPTYRYCEDLGQSLISPQSIPYAFTFKVSVLRAGEIEKEIITSTAALSLDSNLTGYDSQVITGSTPGKNPITIDDGGTLKTYRFLNPRILSMANQEVLAGTVNPLHDFDPGTYPLGSGLCSTNDPGDAMIDLQPGPIVVVLGKQDTIVVELRRGLAAPEGMIPLTTEPQIRSTLLLDDRKIEVQGSDLTGRDPGSYLSFSYTAI